ncbi:MAG: cytochrome C assembly family protein [Acidobacteriaceae bacterium]
MSSFWLRVAVLLYGVASLAVLPAVLYDRPNWRRIALPATICAFFFHFVSLTEMLIVAHHRLPVTLREMQSLMGLLLTGAFLLVYWRYRTVSLGVFVLPIVFLLVLLPAFDPSHPTFSSPYIRSGWIFVHVVLLLAAYAALFFSLLSSLLYLVEERRLKRKNARSIFSWLPPLETMDQIAYKTLLIGFPCMTAGLLAGSLIAQEMVGPAYFLDPKVLLSFAMWIIYIGMIYIRRNAGLRGRRAVYLSSFVFLVILTVWAANMFSSVHRYVTP